MARMVRSAVTLGLVVVAAALGAAPASAARPATPSELARMAPAVGLPATCLSAKVSTVEEGWAAVHPLVTGPCPVGDGFFVLRRTGAGFAKVYAGSVLPVCSRAGVPSAVGRDLKVCRAPRALILCDPATAGFKRVGKVRPSACTTLGPRDPLCCAFNLHKLRWQHWGRPTATARGVERGFHLPLANVDVRLRAYRPRRADCGDRVYTRVRSSSRYGSFTQKFPRVCAE